MAARELVLLQVDGVLVDNVEIRARVWATTLAAFGHRLDAADWTRKLEGRGDHAVRASIERELGHPLGADEQATFETRLHEAYRRELRPVHDILGTLRRLHRPICALSGAPRASARAALEATGLWAAVSPNLFSSEHVASPPPAADLFQFAAAQMGVPVSRCLLVDASELGVRGGRAAGMTVFGFAGGAHTQADAQEARLRAAGAHIVFDRMAELAPLCHARVLA